ncbi:MAG TPA: hypothetical protein VHL14_00405 [Steroidobacteraceae bacterium]|nr:hypothetical protein [Steroidobacteraceae bacterium]
MTISGPSSGQVGVWEEVTPPDVDPALINNGAFGLGSIVVDPVHRTDMYVGGYGYLFKSTDYGMSWKVVPSQPNPGSQALGHVVAVVGTTPATVWVSNGFGDQHIYKSTDGGLTFRLTGTVPGHSGLAGFYSIVVDPYNSNHLLSGLHETDGLVESIDGGETWQLLGGSHWPSGGKSWFVFFVDTGNAATTSETWFAIAQDGGSAVMTRNGGGTWEIPGDIEGLQHPHGNSSLLQIDNTLFVTGINGVNGSGTYRSTDLGLNWKKVSNAGGGVVFGSSKNVYSMWGWACGGCGLNEGGPQLNSALMPGDIWKSWIAAELPARLVWGPNSVATTSDGTHTIYVGSMWATGLWRYVEP